MNQDSTSTSKASNQTTATPSDCTIPEPDTSNWENELSSQNGPLRYTLMNDFLFKYLLQENLYALKGLLAALLCIAVDKILSIVIQNPIELGKIYDDKTFLLDLKLLLNDNRIINLEMQVNFLHYLPERFLSYLCRSFDQLERGDDYSEILPCIQICILDSTLFPENDVRYTDQFLSEYKLLETTTHKEYTGKFTLRVLSLKQLENATDKDSPNGLYQWAKLFKAKTWEDIKMIAKQNNYIKSMVSGLRVLTEDERVKQAYEARRKYELDKNTAYVSGKIDAQRELEPVIAEKESIISEKDSVISEKEAVISEKDSVIFEQQTELEKAQAHIAALEAALANSRNNQS